MNKQLIKVKRSVRNGALETQDMTAVEQVVAIHASKITGVGLFGMAAAKFGAVAVSSKVMAVGGIAVVGGVVAKSFVRGFREQWQTLSRLEA